MSNLSAQDIEIRDDVLDIFKLLNSVARPSNYEEEVSNLIYTWAKERGFEASQDELGNVVIDIPATNGSAEEPKIVMQAHMDMVAVSDDPDFDPVNTPIVPIIDEENGIMYADGTSLGADNAIGLALSMKAAVDPYEHDALRIIVTVGEEIGFVGASQLDPKHLQGLKYLINVDHSDIGESVVSCAGNSVIDYKKDCRFVDAKLPCGYNLNITNTRGGHSGIEINENRINAIKEVTAFYQKLLDNGVEFELVGNRANHASNAIPSDATIEINIKEEDIDKCNQLMEEWKEHLSRTYKNYDVFDINFSVEEPGPRVYCEEDRDAVMGFLHDLPTGVAKFLGVDEIVESSNNLAAIDLEGDTVHIVSSTRGITEDAMHEQVDLNLKIAEKYGFKTEVNDTAKSWKSDRESELITVTNKVWKDITGEEITLVDIHAGIENGAFVSMNPEIQAISIGPDIKHLHSTKEYCKINTIPPIYWLIRGIIEELS